MQPLTYVLKTLEKQAVNGFPIATLHCVPHSGRETVAEMCTLSPDTDLRFANLRLLLIALESRETKNTPQHNFQEVSEYGSVYSSQR